MEQPVSKQENEGSRIRETPDDELKMYEFEGLKNYTMFTTINGFRYQIFFSESPHKRVLSRSNTMQIHFQIAGTETSPITNAGLETFGKLADKISEMYEEIRRQENIQHLHIYASKEGHSPEMVETLKQTIRDNPYALDGFFYERTSPTYTLHINNAEATLTHKGMFGYPVRSYFPVNDQLLIDLKYTAKITPGEVVAPMAHYIATHTVSAETLSSHKLEEQRLKLYRYYFRNRYPEFSVRNKKDAKGVRYLDITIPEQKPEKAVPPSESILKPDSTPV